MFVGFDYGSANCAVGIMQQGEVQLLPMSASSKYMPSTLYALDRELIAEAVYRVIPASMKQEYALSRAAQLSQAKKVRHELDLSDSEQAVFFGDQAVAAYLDMPEEGFYVRSPKSFLGASGLRIEQIALFEDIVTLMMHHVKSTAEQHTPRALTHAIIGRPVNFQAIGGEESNQQAEAILRSAAKRAGFVHVEFLFEPIAAGMAFEAELQQDQTVLVVDVGGGTTDCSVVKMGPSHRKLTDRSADFLGHTGQRIGGNDLDIALAMQGLMPSFGLNSQMRNGLPVPSKPYWNAVAVNDISAQREFATLASRKMLETVIKDAQQPKLLRRLLKVQSNQLGYQLVRQAESAKIGLSNDARVASNLDFIEPGLETELTQIVFAAAIEEPVARIQALMTAVIQKSAAKPDIIYVTGGTAKSPTIYDKIAEIYPETEIVIGDHFGSVTAGLTRWALKVFSSNGA